MKTGVIIGSALAGAAVGAILTLEKKERETIVDFLTDVKDKVFDFAGDVKEKATELVDKLPGKVKDIVPESLAAIGGTRESKGKAPLKGTGMGNVRIAQQMKSAKGGRVTVAKKTGGGKRTTSK